MIPYEELCQALDAFNGRRRNEAELAALEHAPESTDETMLPPEDDPAIAMYPSGEVHAIEDDDEPEGGRRAAARTEDEATRVEFADDLPPLSDVPTEIDPAATEQADPKDDEDRREG